MAASIDEQALALLARREYSRHELRARLARAGHAAEAVAASIERLCQAGYLSDRRFAEMLVRSRLRQGYGPRRLRAELRQHELDDAEIAAALAPADPDWQALAAAQLRRHYGAAPVQDQRERARRMQYLLRRGFDAETARHALAGAGDEA